MEIFGKLSGIVILKKTGFGIADYDTNINIPNI